METGTLKADPRRIRRFLSELSHISSVPGKVTRQTFSDAWLAGVKYVAGEMEKLGMQVRMDGFGNLIGTYNPGQADSKPVAMGSHLDTVIDGGAYDGAAGIAAGLEMVRIFRESGGTLSCPLEVIAFAEEEGGVFGKGCMGSEYVTGNTPLELLNRLKDKKQSTPETAANQVNFPKTRYGTDYGWGRGYYRAFFEIHVEQGNQLEEGKMHIGIVDGVVGIFRSEITFTGQANHAGTTRMSRRKDAVVALAELILDANRYARKRDGDLVITTGKIKVFPNQHNVVPGIASAVMEIRAASGRKISQAFSELQAGAEELAREAKMDVSFSDPVYVKGIRFDGALLDKASEGNPSVTHTFSWAGHDAKLMAKIAPSAMLFVPSRGGMSHCPQECSDPEDIAKAVDLLGKVMEEMVLCYS